jgi:hypothetical protein
MPRDWRHSQANAGSEVVEPSPSWRDKLTRIEDGGGMAYVLDVLLGGLGAGLVIVLYLVFKSMHAKGRHPRGNVAYPYIKRRRWFRFPSRSLISSLILLIAVIMYLWGPQIRQLTGEVSSQTSGQCNIKGNISTSGERIIIGPATATMTKQS